MAPEPSAAAAPSLSASVLWLMGAKALGFAFTFALPVVLVRQLSQHDFGLYKQVFLVVATAIATLPLGFAMSAHYFIPRQRAAAAAIALNVVLVYAALGTLAGLGVALVPELLQAMFGDADLVPLAQLLGLVIALWLPGSVLELLAVANMEAPVASRFIVLVQLTRTALLLTAAAIVGTVESLLVAAAVQGVLNVALLLAYVTRRFPGFWRRFDLGLLRAQVAYALPHGVAALLYWAQIDLHRYVVANQFDAAQFALYTIGCFELPLLAIVNESVGSVLIPRMSELERQRDREELIGLAVRAMRKLALVNWPLYVVLVLTGRDLLTVLFTPRYLDALPIFVINMTLLPFSVPTIACDAVIRAFAEHRYFLIRLRVVAAALMALALWAGVTRYGLVGAITAVVVVNLFERTATTVKAARILRTTRADAARLRPFLWIGAAAGLAAVAGLVTISALGGAPPLARLIAVATVTGVTYGAALLAVRVPTADEHRSVWGLVARIRTAVRSLGSPVPAGGDA